ncbi:MAG: hypothetical protein ACYC6N_32835, partial [Pirellulaceae bacterium]
CRLYPAALAILLLSSTSCIYSGLHPACPEKKWGLGDLFFHIKAHIIEAFCGDLYLCAPRLAPAARGA